MKKLLITLLMPVLLLPNIAKAADTNGDVGEQFRVLHPEVWSVGVLIDDSANLKKQWVSLQAFTGTKPGNTGQIVDIQNCSSYGTKGCESSKYFNYQAMLPYCATESAVNCISNVVATGPDGVSHKATFVEEFPGKTKYSFVGDPSANLPDSGSNFIVSIPDMPHSKGDKYLIASQLNGNKQGADPKFNTGRFQTGIYAVTIVDGRYQVPFSSTELSHYPNAYIGNTAADNSGWDYGINAMPKCAQMSETRCALAWPLPLDVDFELTFRMQVEIKGWLHGRLQDAGANISSSNGLETIKISGKPVVVPIVYKTFPRDQVPAVVTQYYANDPTFELFGYHFGSASGKISTVKGLEQFSTAEFPEALVWYQAISDTAPFSSTAWSFRSIQSGQLGNGCNNDSSTLKGLVTTNSNMYVASPPVFNKAEQSLDYQVTSPHFLPDGSVFKGNYNLVINSDFARCIYGFTQAPISATVAVLSADGSSQVATTVLNEKDGWLRLSASNFTFSAPTIRVLLTQEAKPTPEPEMTTQAAPKAPVKKVTITCAKGKLKKKLTASNPKCPAGYKKVAK